MLTRYLVRSLVASPVTSYADQILSIHRNKTSAGFSLDIPLIMLLASILKSVSTPPFRRLKKTIRT